MLKLPWHCFKMFGAKVAENAENCFTIYPSEVLQAIEYTVEPDASSASYFFGYGRNEWCYQNQ